MGGLEPERRVRLRRLADRLAVGVAVSAILGIVLGALSTPLSAQGSQRVSISVAPTIHAAAESMAQFSIQVRPEGAALQNSFIRVRGLPAFAALSDGYAVTTGSWSVPLGAAGNLSIIVPAGAKGKSEIAIDIVNVDGNVLAQAKTVLMIAAAGSAEHTQLRQAEPIAIAKPGPDPSPLAVIQRGFDAFLARTQPKNEKGEANAVTPDQRADMFRQFLTWSQNPLQVDVNVRLTTMKGAGDLIGTFTVGNTEITVAGRKETALLIKPNLKGLRPGSYAFHIHEHANCESAVKDGEHVPGLAAGQQLWMSGTGGNAMFASNLGNLPRIEVDAEGAATRPVVAARLTLADVANRSLMIHTSQDDNSARMACGRLN